MTRVEPDPSRPKEPDKSLGDLFGELSHELGDLMRTQVEMARAEVEAAADRAKRVVGMFGIAAGAAVIALLLLSFAAAWGLSEVVPEGVAFLIVGAVYAIAAAVLLSRARTQARDINLVPQDTVESLKEDVQWARQKLS